MPMPSNEGVELYDSQSFPTPEFYGPILLLFRQKIGLF